MKFYLLTLFNIVYEFESMGKEVVVKGGLRMTYRLREFQENVKNNLLKGNSTIVIAPTGLGKTLAAVIPFKVSRNLKLGSRIIYTLPIRALAKGVQEEFGSFGINAVIHNGDEPESKWFTERAIITTVDQYFTAFAGAPLSWSSATSHAAAGAVLASYTVFDEIHLLNPKNGLQLLFAVLKLRNRWNLPTTVMTATLPNSVIKFIENTCGLVKVEASREDIKERDSWRKVELVLHNNELDVKKLSAFVEEHWKKYGKVIVFINTVRRAIALYKLLSKNLGNKVLLAHSRFTKNHRKEIEKRIHENFGRNSNFEGILVTTQVAEAGLNISAPLVITELAPMDTLIQRAGRCTRFKENISKVKGKVVVVKPKVENKNNKWYAPYFDRIFVNKGGKSFIRKRGKEKKDVTLSELTWIVLKKECNEDKAIQLNWSKEKELVNICLNAVYKSFIEGKENIDIENLEKSKVFEDNRLGKILNESIEILLEGR